MPGYSVIAVIDVISRYCHVIQLSAEETSTQVETAFIDALISDGKGWLMEDAAFTDQLAAGQIPDPGDDGSGAMPVLLAISDNGPPPPTSYSPP